MRRLLITGTLGFIFSNYLRGPLGETPVVGVDKAVRKHSLDNIYEPPGYRLYLADIADAHTMDNIFAMWRPDVVIGGAAESFVDDSIADMLPFIHSNVLGTQVLVNACVKYGARYIHISTDEVYGQLTDLGDTPWVEERPMAPRNPYAASKACAELIVRAAHETHGLNFNITRCCNVYGPRQKKENLIPHVLHGLFEQKPIRIHGDGLNFRQYIYVDDACDAIRTVLELGLPNRTYNIGGDNIVLNRCVVELLAGTTGRTPIVQHIEDRKAHDRGYHVNSHKLRSLGWAPKVKLDEGLARVAEYYSRSVGQAYAAA